VIEKKKNEIEYYRDGEKYFYDPNLHDSKVGDHHVKKTSFYSVVDPHWSVVYLLDVQAAEREVGHAICGAPTADGTPCKQYPLRLDDETIPEEIGRCRRHRPSLGGGDEEEIDTATSVIPVPNKIIGSPLATSLMNIADDQFFMSCHACIHRAECDEVGKNNNKCIKEKRLFTSLLTEMMDSYDMDSIADYFTSVSLVDTMIKIIRTSSFEGQYGIIESISSGTAQYNIHLKKLLNSTLKLLGVDRKTRITIKHSSGKIEQFGSSLAKALSSANIEEVEVKSATLKMKKKEQIEKIGVRTGPPIGIKGEVIKDDEPIQV